MCVLHSCIAKHRNHKRFRRILFRAAQKAIKWYGKWEKKEDLRDSAVFDADLQISAIYRIYM